MELWRQPGAARVTASCQMMMSTLANIFMIICMIIDLVGNHLSAHIGDHLRDNFGEHLHDHLNDHLHDHVDDHFGDHLHDQLWPSRSPKVVNASFQMTMSIIIPNINRKGLFCS